MDSEQKDNIQNFREEWAVALMSKGIIVDLKISCWRAKTKLTEETLGIKFNSQESEEINRKYINLGTENLLPPEIAKEINNIERMARACLETYSFDTIWGKFVPYNCFEKWKEENRKINDLFNEYVKGLVEKYDSIIDIICSDYEKIAIESWKRKNYGNEDVPQSYIIDFIEKIKSKMPEKIDLIKYFKYDTIFYMVPLPSFIQKDIEHAKQIELDSQINANKKIFEAEQEARIKQSIADTYLERKKDLIEGFLQSTVNNIRESVEELCSGVLDAISRNRDNEITTAQQKRIHKMIERVGFLNFYDDKEINETLLDLKKEIMKVKGERRNGYVVEKLKEIVKISKEEFEPKNFNAITHYLEV